MALRFGTRGRTALELQATNSPRGTRRIRRRPPPACLDVFLQIPAVVSHCAPELHEPRPVASKAPSLQSSYADAETLRGVALRDESSHETHLPARDVPAHWPWAVATAALRQVVQQSGARWWMIDRQDHVTGRRQKRRGEDWRNLQCFTYARLRLSALRSAYPMLTRRLPLIESVLISTSCSAIARNGVQEVAGSNPAGPTTRTRLGNRRARVSALSRTDAHPRNDPPPETTSAILACLRLPVRAPPLAPARRDDGFSHEVANQVLAGFES